MAVETVDALAELASPATNDEIGIWDVSAGQFKKIQVANLLGGTITGGGTIATGGFTLTVPATGTAAVLGVANVFTKEITAQKTATGADVYFMAQADTASILMDALGSTVGGTAFAGLSGNNQIVIEASNSSSLVISASNTAPIIIAPGRVNKVEVGNNGDVAIASLAGSGTRAVYSTSSGVLTNTASDEQLKSNIVPIGAADALAVVNALRPVCYNWIDANARGDQREIGLIAQEVQTLVPEVVGTNGDGMLSLDYARLVPMLIGAVQALSARVAVLEAQCQ